jgi:alkylation response protein AidB-like acyl-CoA dehydrogenase
MDSAGQAPPYRYGLIVATDSSPETFSCKATAHASETGGTMDFSLSDGQKMAVQSAADFAEKEMKPHAVQWEEGGEYDPECFRKAASLGFAGMLVPKKDGGAGLNYLTTAMIYEQLSKGCMATTFSWVVHNNFVRAVHTSGTKQGKELWLQPAMEGNILGAFALTEPDAGSDAGSIKASAIKDGDSYVITGVKNFVTNGGIADCYNVICRTDPEKGHDGMSSIVVEKDRPGLSFGPRDKKMGANAMPTCQMFLDNCRVPKKNLLGPEGSAFKTSMVGIDTARMFVGAMCVGIAQAALDEAIKYAKERVQFNRPLAEFQGLRFMMADMAAEIEAVRLLTYKAAWLIDQNIPATREAAYAKKLGADMAMSVTTRAVQVFGAYGYLCSYPAERYMRWAKMCAFIDGTTQIQQLVIARSLFS